MRFTVAFCHVRVPDGGLAFKTHRLLNHWDVGFGDGTVDAHAGALANNLRGVDQVFEGRLRTRHGTRSAHKMVVNDGLKVVGKIRHRVRRVAGKQEVG